MIKKAIISGVLSSLILLVGCNGEKEEAPEIVVTDGEQEVVVDDQGEAKLLTELKSEIIVAITEQTEIDSESIAIMLGGNVKEISVSVGFPKDVKVDDTMIQQIVEDSIKKVSDTENVTISEENITIKIEKY